MEEWWIAAGIALGLLVLVILIQRARTVKAVAAYDATLDLDSDGQLVGGGMISLAGPRGAPGLLLLHGLTATPQEMGFLAEGLSEKGYRVLVPLITGHGRTVREMGSVGWIDWVASCRKSFRELSDEGREVAVVGLSAGALMAARVAMEEKPAALVCLAPLVGLSHPLAPYSNWLQYIAPYSKKKPTATVDPETGEEVHLEHFSIFDKDAHAARVAHHWIPTSTVASVLALLKTTWKRLGRLALPAMVVGATVDNEIVPEGARTMSRALTGCEPVVYEEVGRGGHVITVDRDREEVLRMVTEFLDEHLPPGPPEDDGLVVDSRTIRPGGE